jgi:hypothetical protein
MPLVYEPVYYRLELQALPHPANVAMLPATVYPIVKKIESSRFEPPFTSLVDLLEKKRAPR